VERCGPMISLRMCGEGSDTQYTGLLDAAQRMVSNRSGVR
jgi:hypothetical protein